MPANRGWYKDRWGSVYIGSDQAGSVRERMGSIWQTYEQGRHWYRYCYRTRHWNGNFIWVGGVTSEMAYAMKIVEGSDNAHP